MNDFANTLVKKWRRGEINEMNYTLVYLVLYYAVLRRANL